MPAIHDYQCDSCNLTRRNVVHPMDQHPACPVCGSVLKVIWDSGEAPSLETFLVHEGRTVTLPGIMPNGGSDIVIQDKKHLARIERDASREAGKEIKVLIP